MFLFLQLKAFFCDDLRRPPSFFTRRSFSHPRRAIRALLENGIGLISLLEVSQTFSPYDFFLFLKQGLAQASSFNVLMIDFFFSCFFSFLLIPFRYGGS